MQIREEAPTFEPEIYIHCYEGVKKAEYFGFDQDWYTIIALEGYF